MKLSEDKANLEATEDEIKGALELVEYFADNNQTIDQLYEYLSSLLRPKIIITLNNPADS